MSIPLSIESPQAKTRKTPERQRSRIAVFLHAASIRFALVGLCAVVACQVIPGDADPMPPDNATAGAVRGVPPATTDVGEFSGRYHDGLPIYLFPRIHVIGYRSAE